LENRITQDAVEEIEKVKKIVAVLVVLVALAVLLACGEAEDAQTDPTPDHNATAQAILTANPIRTPTSTRTPTPTPVPKLGLNQAVVGGTESAFVAKYGSPSSTKPASNGTQQEEFLVGADNISRIGISFYTKSKIVYAVLIGAEGGIWDSLTAINVCLPFGPDDAIYGEHQDLHDSQGNVAGLYQKGSSDELAKNIDAWMFQDSQKKQVTPGTFGIGYYFFLGDNTLATMCALNLGYQPVNQP
jgi:hypothetical protein